MRYKTLAEMKENHPTFFDKGNRRAFGDLKYYKRGNCLIIKGWADAFDHARGMVWRVFDFSENPAFCLFSTSANMASAERVAKEVNEIGRAEYLARRRVSFEV